MGINGYGRREAEEEGAQAYNLTAKLKAIIKETRNRTNADWLVVMRRNRELVTSPSNLRNII